MRDAFANELLDLAKADPRVVLLSGDIGNRMFDKFKAACPGRFYNCGVAEANMTSVAAGMALSGLRPVTYTITAFNTLRCLEQIRLDVCYQNLPVVLVGVGGGLSYASLNATHHALEDIACLRMLPKMTVICPCDAWETRAAMRAALALGAPVYVRLGKKGEPTVHDRVPDFTIGKGMVLREGRDVCFIGTGTMLPTVLAAADRLGRDGMVAGVVNMHTVKPLDVALCAEVFARYPLVVSVEEHSAAGGLGGSIAEWRAGLSTPGLAPLLRIGTADDFMYVAGEQEYAREYFGLTEEHIAAQVAQALRA
ncbi:MAG: transketolase [Lentisphaerae bacterium]|nr:transketolase [Lentisphaerota bacterium]